MVTDNQLKLVATFATGCLQQPSMTKGPGRSGDVKAA